MLRCFPQGLKPANFRDFYGTTEVVPFQDSTVQMPAYKLENR